MNANLVRLTLFLGAAALPAVFQQSIPIRRLSPAEATSAIPVLTRASARELSDGRVMVNEMISFQSRVLLFDPGLATATTIVDSTTLTSGTSRSFVFSVVPYFADSALLADPNGNTLLVLDPSGKITHVLTLPKAREVTSVTAAVTGGPGIDQHGRLIYRGTYPKPPAPTVPGAPNVLGQADTFPLVRADFDARTTDTIATVRIESGQSYSIAVSPENKVIRKVIRQPLPTTDEWAVLNDGSVAIVRGHDYHVDWVLPDGKRVSTPKMAFDWRRVTDEERQRILDSLLAIDAKSRARSDSIARARGEKPQPPSTITEYVPLKEFPDYYPPIRPGSVAGDPSGNVWILPTTSGAARGGLLYDVVNRKGEVFERVQLPSGCALAGFGANGGVYLTCTEKVAGDTASVTRLKRMRVIR